MSSEPLNTAIELHDLEVAGIAVQDGTIQELQAAIESIAPSSACYAKQ